MQLSAINHEVTASMILHTEHIITNQHAFFQYLHKFIKTIGDETVATARRNWWNYVFMRLSSKRRRFTRISDHVIETAIVEVQLTELKEANAFFSLLCIWYRMEKCQLQPCTQSTEVPWQYTQIWLWREGRISYWIRLGCLDTYLARQVRP